MMYDRSNSDSKSDDVKARQVRSPALSDWDDQAMIKAVWSLADCPVLKLFADSAPLERNLLH